MRHAHRKFWNKRRGFRGWAFIPKFCDEDDSISLTKLVSGINEIMCQG